MTDERKPDLLVPDRSIVSLEQAKRELLEKKEPLGTSSSDGFVTKKEMLKIIDRIGGGISDAAVAVGQKVFDQITDETSGMLAQMEHTLRQEFQAELYRRSFAGRWRALLVWLGLRQPPHSGPRIVDPVEVLDPNVATAAADESADVAVVHTH